MKHRAQTRLLILVLLPGTTVAAEKLRVLYDLRPPLVEMRDGVLAGSVGKRARLALELTGIQVDWRETPVPRQDLEIEHALQPVCALGRLRSPERLATGVFSLPILKGPRYVAVLQHDRQMPAPASLQNWAAQKTLHWGIQRGFYYSSVIDAQINRSLASLIPFSRSGNNLSMLLLSGRVDFLLLQEDEATLLVNAPETANQLRIQPLSDLTEGENRYFYCAKATPQATLKALNATLEKLPL